MSFFENNIAAIITAAVVSLASFVFSVNSDVNVLKSESGSRKETDEKILNEIRFVKIYQEKNLEKIDKKLSDTRDRVMKLEGEFDGLKKAKK